MSTILPPNPDQSQEDSLNKQLFKSIQETLQCLSIKKAYFIDDALSVNTDDKDTFIGLIKTAIDDGKIEQLIQIPIQNAIDFSTDLEVIYDYLDSIWDTISYQKRTKYFKHIYKIIGQPDFIKDLDVSNRLKEFFEEDMLVCLTPNEWDLQKEAILSNASSSEKVLILFDQDLKHGQGRFSSGTKGEDLILELVSLEVLDKIHIALFTHTISSHEEELPERENICSRIDTLTSNTFFVLAKSRLDQYSLFADGIKKTCLNAYCENIKTKTIEILSEAQEKTIETLKKIDTYDFDDTIFKSSLNEGVLEQDTLLRITDIIFQDEVRKLMIQKSYIPLVNDDIISARGITSIHYPINGSIPSSLQKNRLRHKELYENSSYLNKLRRPIDNGDIFQISSGQNQGRTYILLAQECDLMVRHDGSRNSRTAILCEIKSLSEQQLISEISRKYRGEIQNSKFLNHFYADKFKLDYFVDGTNDIGLVKFSNFLTIDLNILDLCTFNPEGSSIINTQDPSFESNFYNQSWINRFSIILQEFINEAQILDPIYSSINKLEDQSQKNEILKRVSRAISFIFPLGIELNYQDKVFNFGIKRISRLRFPKSKYLLDRYFQHLSRVAEQHDFAQTV